MEDAFEEGHEESRRDAFSDDVCDDNAELVVFECKEIVVVAADFVCWYGACSEFYFWEVGEFVGKEALLYGVCYFEFLF